MFAASKSLVYHVPIQTKRNKTKTNCPRFIICLHYFIVPRIKIHILRAHTSSSYKNARYIIEQGAVRTSHDSGRVSHFKDIEHMAVLAVGIHKHVYQPNKCNKPSKTFDMVERERRRKRLRFHFPQEQLESWGEMSSHLT